MSADREFFEDWETDFEDEEFSSDLFGATTGRKMNEARRADLAEEFMPLAKEIAEEMDDGKIPLDDLIAEAYVGLVTGINQLVEEEDDWGGKPMDLAIEEAIRKAVEDAQKEAKALQIKDDQVIAQVEKLNKSIDHLTEEFGDKPTVDELANDLEMPQEKVMDILKLLGENVEEA